MKKLLVVGAMLAAVLGVWACSSDSTTPTPATMENGEPTSPYPSCQAILHACHPKDIGEGPPHDCHELAHDDGTEAKCAAKKDECVKTCDSFDAGSSSGG